MIIGTDVSFYQDDLTTLNRAIDFAAMKAGGARFTIIRAGQNLWKDNEFDLSWKNARAAGLPRGAYWFYDSRVAPKRQAELWVSVMGDDLGELPLWCDFEDKYGGAYTGWKHFYDFMATLERLVPGKALGVYTGYYYWREMAIAKGIPTASLNYFKQFPLWVAAYNNTAPLVPAPWSDWTLWQFTDNGDGTKYGVESKNIDLNYFNGDEAQFQTVFGVGGMPETGEPPDGSGEAVRVVSADLTITLSDQSIIKLRRTS